jgi:hypothetical protein
VTNRGFVETYWRVIVRNGNECRVAVLIGKQSLSFEKVFVVAYVLPEHASQRTPRPNVLG